MKKMTEIAMRTSDAGAMYNVVCYGSSKHGYKNISCGHIYAVAAAIYQAHRSHRGYGAYYCYLYKNGKYSDGGYIGY